MVSKEDFYSKFYHLSEFDSKVGIFSSFMLKNNKSYSLGYLNALIHGLLRATKKLGIYIFYYKSSNFKFEEINKLCEYKLKNYTPSESHRGVIPQLVSFNIGDLLRCRCFSK